MKTCILIRHAATAGNAEKRYIGRRTDEDILDIKKAQVRRVAEDIHNIITDPFVISGPLKRCLSTVYTLLPSYDVRIEEGLSEIDFGAFEGKTYDELKDLKDYRDWISGELLAPPGGESKDEYIKRSVNAFFDSLRSAADAKELLIVCCGGNIMAIMSHLTGKDYYDFQAGNLEGYTLRFEYDEGIHDLSYDRFVGGNNT